MGAAGGAVGGEVGGALIRTGTAAAGTGGWGTLLDGAFVALAAAAGLEVGNVCGCACTLLQASRCAVLASTSHETYFMQQA